MTGINGTARTAEEIVERVSSLADDDFFGFETHDLIVRLPFEHAKEFLKEGAVEADWTPAASLLASDIVSYLPFAWDKASNCRGLSASRSVSHFRAWLWLDGHAPEVMDLVEYHLYGKPHLVLISEIYGFDWRPHDRYGWANNDDGPNQFSERRVEEIKALAAAHRRPFVSEGCEA